jgi:hypothetical protein
MIISDYESLLNRGGMIQLFFQLPVGVSSHRFQKGPVSAWIRWRKGLGIFERKVANRFK